MLQRGVRILGLCSNAVVPSVPLKVVLAVLLGGNVLDSNMTMSGRPPGPRMPCGWGCGAQLTARLMRGHFTDCSNRPGEFGHKAPVAPKRA